MILFTVSALNTKISVSIFLLYSVSLIGSAILGKAIFKESIGYQHRIAISLSLLGILIFSGVINNTLDLNLGFVTGLIAGVFDAFANASRKLVKSIDWRKLLVYQFSFGLALTLLSRLLLYGFSRVDLNIATPILASELIIAVALGWVLLNEHLSVFQIVGGIIIMLATIIASIDVSRFKKSSV